MARIEINGNEIEVESGVTVIEAADRAGIYIPRFCYHEKLSVAANCRMCMVDVENAPKPLPACATPVVDGMKVYTESQRAVDAQKSTMEFLLINHPLDCPICDQGGECPLQDQALGYGKDASRFTEKKRVVEDKDIGPLIETAMTRCIHCTRCIRFGEEIAGIAEMGGIGRGEDLEIGTFLNRSIDSEVSGNMIDLCPVGALTSKPYRYTARSWEMTRCDAVSPHDCVGANLTLHALRGQVKRVVPRANPEVNDCWISDRDRFSYEAVNCDARLTGALLKSGDGWRPVDWETAFAAASRGLLEVVRRDGPDAVGALIGPLSTNEEAYLFQKALRGVGCNNIDHRLRQTDFDDDRAADAYPGSELALSAIDALGSILLIGSNVRKEQPLLGLRVRAARRNGARVFALNTMDHRFNFEPSGSSIVDPASLPGALARVALGIAELNGARPPDAILAWAESVAPDPVYAAVAEALVADGANAVVALGDGARRHRRASVLRAIANWMRASCAVRRIDLPEANGAGLWIGGCVPHRAPRGLDLAMPGLNARDMIAAPRRAYVLYGFDAALDCVYGRALDAALRDAELVVWFSAFRSETMNHAHVALPIAAFTETDGGYVNVEGRVQHGRAAVRPMGDARPGWKVLRVWGNRLGLKGFDYLDVDDVRAEAALGTALERPRFENRAVVAPSADEVVAAPGSDDETFQRILEVPIYRVDPYVRRAPALQATADALDETGAGAEPVARLNPVHFAPRDAARFTPRAGAPVDVVAGDGARVRLEARADARVPAGCVYVPSGFARTAALDAAARVTLERA